MDTEKLQAELRKARRQLLLLYEVGNLMRTTLKFDEIVFLVLSAVTSHEGLGFNRAVLFLADDAHQELKGVFGIGPRDPQESMSVWRDIDQQKLHLVGFIDVYRKQKGNIDPILNRVVRELRIPLGQSESLLARTFLEGMPFSVQTGEVRRAHADPVLDELRVTQFAAVPVKGKDQVIGVILADNISTGKPITKEEVLNLSMLADHAGLAIENAKFFHQVLETARKDSLTELWNHAHFQELLVQSLQVARLQHQPLSLVVFDVDDFKRTNDLLGHQKGDQALQAIGRISRTVLRRNDYIARYGGEEFAVIFPGSTKPEALGLAEKLRQEIEKQTAGLFGGGPIERITISGGVATFPQDAEDREKLIFCADAALYEAKKLGKNRISAYQKV
jgi:diguanylate cyclase (GGDEF)-like protein